MHFHAPLLFAGLAAAGPTFSARSPVAFGLVAVEKRYTFPLPDSEGSVTFSEAQTISGSFDGGMKTYGRGVSCTGQAEGGNADAVFLLEDGASLSNVIIGEDQIEGIHCMGSCTLENVWWSAVCEDALTFKGDGDATVTGGGAQGAEDKVMQHNGIGSVTIDGFTVYDFGKLYRSCGNCKGNGEARKVTIKNVTAVSGKLLAGINANYGDVATIDTSNCASSVKNICETFTGNSDGDEPPAISTDADSYCDFTTVGAC